jgi:hypothetical protein
MDDTLDLMTARLRAFGEGLGLDADHVKKLLEATPEQCKATGRLTVTTLDAVVIKQGKEISRLEGLVKMHQDNAASLGEDISVALGYPGPPNNGDALRAWAHRIKQERDEKAGSCLEPTDTWSRDLKNGMQAEAYRFESWVAETKDFGWRIQTRVKKSGFVSGSAPTLEDAIKTVLKRAVELDLLNEDVLCYKCGLEAEINDGDDASGPPVCCSCYTSGLEAPC